VIDGLMAWDLTFAFHRDRSKAKNLQCLAECVATDITADVVEARKHLVHHDMTERKRRPGAHQICISAAAMLAMANFRSLRGIGSQARCS